jgi:aldehyde dehydrogenase (NAD+)
VLNLVFGSGSQVGDPMVAHPGIQVISFTGSTDVGLAIAGKGGAIGKRISLEMGGKNAILVMEDADLALATDAIVWSAFGTTGQRCTACSRVLVHARVHDDLAQRVAARAKQLRLGDGLEATTEVGPLVNAKQVETVAQYVGIGAGEGSLLAGGEPAREGALAKGHFYRPTVFAGVAANARVAVEEIFGPVLAMVKVKDLEEAVAVNNASRYGLSSSIFTADVRRAFAAMRDLETGIVYVHHRRRDPPALRRHPRHRQRSPRGRPHDARPLHRVEEHLRGLQRPPAARPDRQQLRSLAARVRDPHLPPTRLLP